MLIQAFVYPNFTTMDLIGALQPLALMPYTRTELVWKERGSIPSDAGVNLVADQSFETASKSPDILIVPGGGSPSIDLLEDQEAMSFIANQGQSADWVVAVCTGSLALGMAGLLEGYRAASHWVTIDTLDAFGAIPTHERVVIDRNRCTGGGVTAGVDIGLTMVGEVSGETIGKVLELGLEYNPQPPYKTGHPSIADENTLTIAKQTFAQSLSVDRIREIAATRYSQQRKHA